MAKKVKFVSPIGTAQWPKLTTPDTFGEYADNKYKTNLIIHPNDLVKVKAQLNAELKNHTFKVKNPKLPIKEDKDGNEVLVFKSQRLPTIFDARNNKIVDGWNPPSLDKLKAINIGPGSTIRVAATYFAYDKGLSLQLESVQVIELVAGSGGSDFDEVEGYDSFSQAEAGGFGGDDASGSDEAGEEIDL